MVQVMREVKQIMIFGTGVMGLQIAQIVAQAGFNVILRSRKMETLESGLRKIKKRLQKNVDKKIMTREEAERTSANIIGTIDILDAGKDVDLIIEAIIENMDAKKELLKQLDNVCPQHTIFASNTSSLSITELASSTSRPARVVGMHFFNPATRMKLVEVVRGEVTSQETIDAVVDLAKKLGKTPIVINDSPGFLVNRMLIPMINEAAYILLEEVARKEDIDLSMKMGANFPMGPLELADLIGVDVCLNIMESFYKEFGDPKYRPCPILRKMVRMKYLGRKVGKGFYDYNI